MNEVIIKLAQQEIITMRRAVIDRDADTALAMVAHCRESGAGVDRGDEKSPRRMTCPYAVRSE